MKRIFWMVSIVAMSLGLGHFLPIACDADATDSGRTLSAGNTGSNNWVQDTHSKDVSKAYGEGEEDEGETDNVPGASQSPSNLVLESNEGEPVVETPFSNEPRASIMGSVVSQSGDSDDSVPKQEKAAL